ncbi:hypothetical protein LINPERPRIM_LOCUS20420 [Linum perenne]
MEEIRKGWPRCEGLCSKG